MRKHEAGVSEIIGTMLVFAMVITSFSALELWYVPNTEGAYEQQFQQESQASLVSLISQIESPSLSYGDVISQNIPLGIQGTLLSPSQPSSIAYQEGGFSASLSYGLGINYKLLENTVPTAITNEVVGTIPDMNGLGPSQSLTENGITYIIDYTSNSMEEIDDTTHTVIGNFRVGLNPSGIAYDQQNGNLYISNFFAYTNYNGYLFSTITVFNTESNKIVNTINSGGLNTQLLYPSGITFVPQPSGSGGYLYVSVMNLTSGGVSAGYTPDIAIIDLSDTSTVNLIETSLPPAGLEESNVIAVSGLSGLYLEIFSTDYWQNSLTVLGISIGSSGGSFTAPLLSYVSSVPEPYGIAYDPVSQNILVTDSSYLLTSSGIPHPNQAINGAGPQSGKMTVVNAALGTPAVSGTVNLNISEPLAIAINASSQAGTSTVYVTGYNVSFNGTGGFYYSPIVALYNSGSGAYQIDKAMSFNYPNGTLPYLEGPDALDISAGQLIISSNFTSNTVFLPISGISGSSPPSYVWNNMLNDPVAITYINGTQYLAVVNSGSDNVIVIDTLNNYTVVGNYGVGQEPTSVAYDPSNGYLYVTNNLSENVTIINPSLGNPSAGYTVANISLVAPGTVPRLFPDPSYAVYDPHNQSVYVLDNGSGNITQIVQIGKNQFTTYTFTINPSPSYPAEYSYVKGPKGQFGREKPPYYSSGSEEFKMIAGGSVNYLSLQLKGSGTLTVGIGTGNLTSSEWNSEFSVSVPISVNKGGRKGFMESIPISLFSLPAGTYYINVDCTSTLNWVLASTSSSKALQLNDISSFHFNSNGFFVQDSNVQFGYEIEYKSPASSSSSPPYPTAAVISPLVYRNIMYVTFYGNANVSAINLSSTAYPFYHFYRVGLLPRDIVYDPLDNNIYVGNSGSGNVSVIDVLNNNKGTFSVESANVPAYPMGLTMDNGNGYVYIGNNNSNNITLENTFTSQTINSIATGNDPSALAYDSENGLIYALDTLSNKMTIINGGSIYFNQKPGTINVSTLTGGGQLTAYGYTAFVNPVAYYMQDGMVLSNYSNNQYVTSSANVPISIVNNSGKLFFSSFLLNLGGQTSSASGIETNQLTLSVSQFESNHRYQGEKFTHYDLYGNPYPAMVTNLTLIHFSYVINSNYASEIDRVLFSEFNKDMKGNLYSWAFSSFPLNVTLDPAGTKLSITMPAQDYMSLYSVNIVYESLQVINV